MIDTLMGRQEAEARPDTDDMLVQLSPFGRRAVPRRWRPGQPFSSPTRPVSSPGSTFPSTGASSRRSAAAGRAARMSDDLDVRGLLDPELRPVLGPFELPPIDHDGIAAIRAASFQAPDLSDAVTRTDHLVPGDPPVRVRVHRPAGAEGAASRDRHHPRRWLRHRLLRHGRPAARSRGARSSGSSASRWSTGSLPRLRIRGRSMTATPRCAGPTTTPTELGVDPERIGVYGLSAGGGLAAALALLARDRGEVPLAFQLLDCPMLDDRQTTPSIRAAACTCGTRGPTSSAGGPTSASCYGADDVPTYAAAARATELAGLPPACVIVGSIDGFRDEDIDYAQRLNQAGVPCELHVIAGLPHAYLLVPGAAAVQLAERCRDDWLRPPAPRRRRRRRSPIAPTRCSDSSERAGPAGPGADHGVLDEGRRQLPVGRGRCRPARSCDRARRRSSAAPRGATRRPGTRSWYVSVWLSTPVESVRWACAWPTPACGRMAVPMRKPSVEYATSAWSVAGSSGAPAKRTHTSSSGGPTSSGSLRSTSPTMPISHAPSPRTWPATSSGLDVERARVGVPDDVVLLRTQKDQRAGADLVALADGHRAARHRASGVHALDGDLEGRLVRRATGEDGVDGLDRLPVLAGQTRHDRLGQQLAAEDDAVRRRQVGGAVAVFADRLERQGLEEGIDGRHRDSFSQRVRAWCASAPAANTAGSTRWDVAVRPRRPGRFGDARPLPWDADGHPVNFDDDVKVRYPPDQGYPGVCACVPCCDRRARPLPCRMIRATRGRVPWPRQ